MGKPKAAELVLPARLVAPNPGPLNPVSAEDRQRFPYKTSNKVVLVGFCQGSRDMAPYDDPDCEIWGLNKGYIFQPRMTRWFETHGPNIYRWAIRRPDRHVDWLKAFPGPIYMHDRDADIPNSLAFPLEAVAEDIGVNVWKIQDDLKTLEPLTRNPYLTSTIAYQIALAIYERFDELHLYGIDLNTGGEYAWQKPGVEFLLGIAAGRGMRVIVPENCALLKGKLYGRGFKQPGGEAITKTQYEVRLEEVKKQREQLTAQFHQLVGQFNECKVIMELMPPGIDHEKLSDRSKQLYAAMEDSRGKANQLLGSEKEIQYWISFTPEGQDGREALDQLAAESKNGHGDQPIPPLDEVLAQQQEAVLVA